jgi:hypothetical protein
LTALIERVEVTSSAGGFDVRMFGHPGRELEAAHISGFWDIFWFHLSKVRIWFGHISYRIY